MCRPPSIVRGTLADLKAHRQTNLNNLFSGYGRTYIQTTKNTHRRSGRTLNCRQWRRVWPRDTSTVRLRRGRHPRSESNDGSRTHWCSLYEADTHTHIRAIHIRTRLIFSVISMISVAGFHCVVDESVPPSITSVCDVSDIVHPSSTPRPANAVDNIASRRAMQCLVKPERP